MEAGPSPWELAVEAAAHSGVTVDPIDAGEDPRRVAAVIERVWGPGVMPESLLRAFRHAGSVLLAARSAEGELPGFVLGFLGWRDGLHLHSHMLAVLPEWRSRGVGLALKLAQRATCLERGVDEVRWTFDPLVARNARFNLMKLGALATAYLPDFYGPMPDRLNAGDRSDRFEVRWLLRSTRVRAALSGALEPVEEPPLPTLLRPEGPQDLPYPEEIEAAPAPEGAVVMVPTDHETMRIRDPQLAMRWREASGRAFSACFGAGLVATAIARSGRYRFERLGEAG